MPRSIVHMDGQRNQCQSKVYAKFSIQYCNSIRMEDENEKREMLTFIVDSILEQIHDRDFTYYYVSGGVAG